MTDMGVGSWFQQGPGNSGSSIGKVSDEPLTFTAPDASTVGSTSAELVAASAAPTRNVVISIPNTATGGIHINFDAAATTSKYLLQPGDRLALSTLQQIRAIRAGASDVTVYVLTGVT